MHERRVTSDEQLLCEGQLEMDKEAEALMKEAIQYKQANRLADARVCYSQAIAHDLAETVLYYGLAKVNYLLGEQEEAVSNYMRAAHLSLNHISEAIDGKGVETELVRERLGQLDGELEQALQEVSEYAPLLMLDENTARNLGHALVDLAAKPPARVKTNLATYRCSLLGAEGLPEDALAELGKLDGEVYLPAGREYLVENILWEMIGDGDVYKMY